MRKEDDGVPERVAVPCCVPPAVPCVLFPVWKEGHVTDGRLRSLGLLCSDTETFVSF